MLSKKNRIICLVLAFLLVVSSFSLFAKSQKYDEMRFQLGFGGFVSTASLLGLIESASIYQATTTDTDYDYPGMTDAEKAALQELSGSMQRALLVANILGSLEYGLDVRILWKILMAEVDLVLLPFDGSYNGRLDFMVTPMIGIRCPWFIMPYILAGPTFTFSFYPSEFTSKENWKGDWAATDNFVFRPGVNVRAGLDFKFKGVSFGVYAQYTIKDFQEFSLWYQEIIDAGYTSAEAAGKVAAAQMRVGASFNIYIF